MINTLKDLELKGKKVLLQLDFEEPLESYRETIEYLLKQSAAIIVVGSLRTGLSIAPWVDELEKVAGCSVAFLSHSVFEKAVPSQVEDALSEGKVVLLENLISYPEEKKGDSVLAQALSRFADVYVNEAFGLSHLAYASLVQLPDFLESAAGFNLMKEKEAIERLKENSLTVVLGGDKVVESLQLAFDFSDKADHILVSGKIAEAIFRVNGISPGKDWPNEQAVKLVKKLKLTDNKLHLPVDVVTGPKNLDDSYRRVFAPGDVRKEDDIYDIGPETIRLFSEVVNRSAALVWRGPLGLYTWPEFSRGTQALAEAVTEKQGMYSVVGGREMVSFLDKVGLSDKFSHVSSGGEAMMRLAAGRELPALKALSGDKLID